MQKISYEFKAHCLGLKYGNKPLFQVLRKMHYIFCVCNGSEYDKVKQVYFDIKLDIRKKFRKAEIIECEKLNKAFYNRLQRLKSRVEYIVNSGKGIFLTLTFTDKVLSITNSETRKKYIWRFLKSLNCNFIANIDFGAKKHREHYHALVMCDSVDNKSYPYGAINFQRIHETSDSVKLAKYVAKLTNHAIKETTKRSVIMYSKGDWKNV